MLQTDQRFPDVDMNKNGLIINMDGSVDIYFGPKAPKGKENNWIQTIPGRGWNMLLRLYGPLEPWFDDEWQPGDSEVVELYDVFKKECFQSMVQTFDINV